VLCFRTRKLDLTIDCRPYSWSSHATGFAEGK
jgi:hypothetical protein